MRASIGRGVEVREGSLKQGRTGGGGGGDALGSRWEKVADLGRVYKPQKQLRVRVAMQRQVGNHISQGRNGGRVSLGRHPRGGEGDGTKLSLRKAGSVCESTGGGGEQGRAQAQGLSQAGDRIHLQPGGSRATFP